VCKFFYTVQFITVSLKINFCSLTPVRPKLMIFISNKFRNTINYFTDVPYLRLFYKRTSKTET